MRSNHNRSGASTRAVPGLRLSPVPLEWLDAGSWRLPSGKALAEFALQAGFLAPLLLKTERLEAEPVDAKPFGKGETDGTSLVDRRTPERSKHFGKGSSR